MRTIHAIRLKPGQDLRVSLDQFVKDRSICAGWIVACVGSLTQYNLRFANQQAGQIRKDFFEIISLSGTLGVDGGHFHIAVSDSDGTLTAGHLLEGCIIYTTAEIVIEETTDLVFAREMDSTTEWKELQIKKNADS
ncbi:MAG TPA: PPC domain-containing DNA-binding protein [Flavitalea sp.]|nr:PPC domain-containing DNA-binding protein [Flavitalea sp.]